MYFLQIYNGQAIMRIFSQGGASGNDPLKAGEAEAAFVSGQKTSGSRKWVTTPDDFLLKLMDREAWAACSPWITKSWARLELQGTHTYCHYDS